MFSRIIVFGWVLCEGTSWTQFLDANVELFIENNFSMWGQEDFCSCPKLLELEFLAFRANFADLGFGEELSMPHMEKLVNVLLLLLM